MPLAVAQAVKDVEPEVDPMIRWPRAVEVQGRKVSGSLVEVRREEGTEHLAAGIGVNVNADFCNNGTFSQDVTSLRCCAQKLIDREQLLAQLCNNLELYLEMSPSDLDLHTCVGRLLRPWTVKFPSTTRRASSRW